METAWSARIAAVSAPVAPSMAAGPPVSQNVWLAKWGARARNEMPVAISPLRDRVVNLVREAPSMEAAAEQLAALLAEPEPMAQLRETIARAMLEGRLSGLIGLELGAAPAGA